MIYKWEGEEREHSLDFPPELDSWICGRQGIGDGERETINQLGLRAQQEKGALYLAETEQRAQVCTHTQHTSLWASVFPSVRW